MAQFLLCRMVVVSGASIQGVYQRATRALRTQSPLMRAKQGPSAFEMLPSRRVAGIARLIPEPRPRCARNRLRRPNLSRERKRVTRFRNVVQLAVGGNGALPSMARTCAVAQASLRLSKFAPRVQPPLSRAKKKGHACARPFFFAWWRRRELNPRPTIRLLRYYMLSAVI